MTTLTKENFTAALKQAVVERGEDFVYPIQKWGNSGTCAYSQKGNKEPGCLIGHALWLIDPAFLPEYSDSSCVNVILTRLGMTDLFVLRAAGRAQRMQDRGFTWGEALNEYETILLLTDHLPVE